MNETNIYKNLKPPCSINNKHAANLIFKRAVASDEESTSTT